VDYILQILVQFIFRVSFGLSLSMAITPSRLVTSGYYRVHLWVLMGMNTAAALALYSSRASFEAGLVSWSVVFALSIALAVISYCGSVFWLYEHPKGGHAALFAVALISTAAALLGTPWPEQVTSAKLFAAMADLLSSGLLLGATLAAMFLGHWYLNTPGMKLLPLQRLVILMMVAVAVRSAVCAFSIYLQLAYGDSLTFLAWAFIALRWLSGLLGTLMLGVLTWQTLKIPNTQSATGILYAGVLLTFIGELTSQLLSVDALIR
jgi:hypothetical protein